MRAVDFQDPSDFPSASCGPCYPKDAPEDVFLDCLDTVSRESGSYLTDMRDFAVRTFRRFWIEWQQIEEVPTHASGEEGAIALLHTMTGSKNREEALRAYCFLLAIGRTPLTQTDVAHLFWDSDGNPSTPGEEKKKSYTTKQLEKKDLRKATVNARVLAIQENLDLGQVPGMKSQDAREVYAIRAGRVHEEKRKQIGLLWKEQPPNLLKQALSLPR